MSSYRFYVRRGRSGLLIAIAALLGSPLLVVGSEAPALAAGDTPPPMKPADPEYQGAIKEGDKHFLAKSFAQAEKAYQRAVARQSDNPEAYGRLAAAQRELGKLDEAFETLGRGLQTSGSVTEHAKLLFLQADLKERQRTLPKATERWNAYLDTASGGERTIDLDEPEEETPAPAASGAKVYPATAHERLKQIAAAEQRFEKYGVVKERIRKREAKAEAAARRAK